MTAINHICLELDIQSCSESDFQPASLVGRKDDHLLYISTYAENGFLGLGHLFWFALAWQTGKT